MKVLVEEFTDMKNQNNINRTFSYVSLMYRINERGRGHNFKKNTVSTEMNKLKKGDEEYHIKVDYGKHTDVAGKMIRDIHRHESFMVHEIHLGWFSERQIKRRGELRKEITRLEKELKEIGG
jgi:hypothetical protein